MLFGSALNKKSDILDVSLYDASLKAIRQEVTIHHHDNPLTTRGYVYLASDNA